jgi:hypothetical protein
MDNFTWKIIRLLQRFALPVGIAVALWGVFEYMIDNPNGKERVKKAFFGYIAIFIIPLIFFYVKSAFDDMANEMVN